MAELSCWKVLEGAVGWGKTVYDRWCDRVYAVAQMISLRNLAVLMRLEIFFLFADSNASVVVFAGFCRFRKSKRSDTKPAVFQHRRLKVRHRTSKVFVWTLEERIGFDGSPLVEAGWKFRCQWIATFWTSSLFEAFLDVYRRPEGGLQQVFVVCLFAYPRVLLCGPNQSLWKGMQTLICIPIWSSVQHEQCTALWAVDQVSALTKIILL